LTIGLHTVDGIIAILTTYRDSSGQIMTDMWEKCSKNGEFPKIGESVQNNLRSNGKLQESNQSEFIDSCH
jgi:hypothetical protein